MHDITGWVHTIIQLYKKHNQPFDGLDFFEVLSSSKLKEQVSMSFFPARQVEHELKAAQEVWRPGGAWMMGEQGSSYQWF